MQLHRRSPWAIDGSQLLRNNGANIERQAGDEDVRNILALLVPISHAFGFNGSWFITLDPAGVIGVAPLCPGGAQAEYAAT